MRIILLGLALLLPLTVHAQDVEQSDVTPVSVPQDRIVAKVNADIITSGDIWQRYYTVQRSAGLPDNADIRRDAFPQILNSLIDERLQLQEAERLDVQVGEEILSTAMTDLALSNRVESKQEFEAMLEKQGVSMLNVERQIKPQVAWAGVVQRLLRPEVTVSEQEVQTLSDRLNSTKGQIEYQIAEIKLDASDAEKQNLSLNLAKQLMEEMGKGAPFRQVAAEFSQSASAEHGGLRGWVTAGELPAQVSSVLIDLGNGRLSNPIVADGFVWLILRLDERTAEGAPDNSVLRERLFNQKLENASAEYLQSLRDQALIVFP